MTATESAVSVRDPAHAVQDLDATIALLIRTPAALSAMLRDLPEVWTLRDEGRRPDGKETWTVAEVVGHLLHTERGNWIPRVEAILQFGETQTFPPLNREAHREEAIKAQSLAHRLDEFASVRSTNLDRLRALNLQPKDLLRRGNHPVFGPVILSQVLATWAVHDLTHLHQISRIMAHQYREAVGPWKVYLGVLQCRGHSS